MDEHRPHKIWTSIGDKVQELGDLMGPDWVRARVAEVIGAESSEIK